MHLLLAIIGIAVHAASTLPIIAALVILAGRRGNGQFCLLGAARLMALNLTLALTGPLWLMGSYYLEIRHFQAPLAQQLAPLFQAAGLPWSASFLVWLLGFGLLASALQSLRSKMRKLRQDRYFAGQLRWPVSGALAAAVCFFATYLLLNWPFAGLPEGLAWDRAIMAIFRNASRGYFLAFCPAGAIGLVALNFWKQTFTELQTTLAVRWLAFWAAAGCIPTLLIAWGTLMGLGFNSGANSAFAPQATGLICLTTALLFWLLLLWRPHSWRVFGLLAFLLFLLKTALPIILRAGV